MKQMPSDVHLHSSLYSLLVVSNGLTFFLKSLWYYSHLLLLSCYKSYIVYIVHNLIVVTEKNVIIESDFLALDDKYHHHLSIRNKYKKMWRVFFLYKLFLWHSSVFKTGYFYIYRLTLICELISIICENRDGHGGAVRTKIISST